MRPNTAHALFVAKHNELKLQEQGLEAGGQTLEMLGTIRVPQNMSLLKSNLPEKNYQSDKEKEEAIRRQSAERRLQIEQVIQEEDDEEAQDAFIPQTVAPMRQESVKGQINRGSAFRRKQIKLPTQLV